MLNWHISLMIIVFMLNYFSWSVVRALLFWIGWFSIEFRHWGWIGGTLSYPLFWCYLYFYYVIIGMFHLWWRCYVIYLQLTWPCRRYFMQYDDHGLVCTTWSNVDFYVIYYVKCDDIYQLVKQCESICDLLMLCSWSS